MNRSDMIELTSSARSPLERFEIHDHGDVRTLAAYERSVGSVQPAATDLTERVGASLGRRPLVPRVPA